MTLKLVMLWPGFRRAAELFCADTHHGLTILEDDARRTLTKAEVDQMCLRLVERAVDNMTIAFPQVNAVDTYLRDLPEERLKTLCQVDGPCEDYPFEVAIRQAVYGTEQCLARVWEVCTGG